MMNVRIVNFAGFLKRSLANQTWKILSETLPVQQGNAMTSAPEIWTRISFKLLNSLSTLNPFYFQLLFFV